MKRRNFLKQLGLAASASWLARNAIAAPDATAKATATAHHLLSCNIRVALPEDEAAGNGWSVRRDLCLDVIRAQKPDIVCFQEVIRVQMMDLEKGLPNLAGFGFEGPEMDARLVGYQGIAKNPVFYSRERYDFVSAGCFWLSETPHIPGSLSWESARARHVNWVRLRDRATKQQFRVLSTHLDHISQRAREEQIKMILAEAAVYAPEFPQILAGDLNAGIKNNVLKFALDAGWTNTRTAAPELHDDGNTTHGFSEEKDPAKVEAARKRGPIDFVLTRGPVSTLAWKILRDSKEGRYPSDHFFISAKLMLV